VPHSAAVFVNWLFRFLHVGSAVLFVGGVFYARRVLVPILNILPEDARMSSAAGAQLRFRAILWVLLVLLVGSGIYQLLTGPPHTPTYHAWFGVKMLLVAHILATAILWGTSPYGDVNIAGKGKRRLANMVISGGIVIAISAWLRSMTFRGL
jgi:hypothetical protein